jgi:hypothetical protein
MAEVFDSYTGEPFKEEYQSQIEGISEGRSPFYKARELQFISEQYHVSPAAEGWRVRRRGCPAELFPVMPAQLQAVRMMDWMVQNDGSVGVAIYWLSRKQLQPFFNLLDRLMIAAETEGVNG